MSTKKKAPPARKPGRPSRLTPAMSEAICARLAEGESLRSICEDEEFPAYSTVKAWEQKDAEFSAASLRAREIGCHALAEDCLKIADDGRNDWMERRGKDDAGWVANGEHIQRSRLRIDTRMRLLGKWLPKVYGDKLALGGADDLPPLRQEHSVALSPEEAYKRMLGG